jgi:KDO2-lipid IV(A) lauroyltransferase
MNKAFEPSDLYWAFVWVTKKLFYSLVPIRFLFFWWKVKGYYRMFVAGERRMVKQNLLSLLGDKKNEQEIKSIIRRHFVFLETRGPMHILPKLKGFAKAKLWQIEGLHHLEAACSRGKGVILLTGHFGYSPLIKYILKAWGYEVRRVRAQKSKKLKALKKAKRQLENSSRFRRSMYDRFHIEPAGFDDDDLVADFNVRPLVQCLKKNEILLFLADALHAANFVELPLLGEPYPFATGYMSMAMMSDAAILPLFAVDHPEGFGVKIVIQKPLQLDGQRVQNLEAIRTNIARFVRLFESYVIQYPHLYNIWTKEDWFESRRARSQKPLVERY